MAWYGPHLVLQTKLRLELVADIPDRTEVPWMGRVHLHLLAQS